MIRAGILIVLTAAPAQAAEFEFCWFGANGFTVEGRMSVPDDALTQTRVTHDDVTAFSIVGLRDGIVIGGWSLENLTPATSWNLNFDPLTMTFATGGFSTTTEGQQWNASGSVDNCGSPGFGFNSGGGGQDVCLYNTYRTDSMVAADTPFPVYRLGEGPSCAVAPLMGGLMTQDHAAS